MQNSEKMSEPISRGGLSGPGKPPTGILPSNQPERPQDHLLNGLLSPPPHNGKRNPAANSTRVRRSASTGRDKKSELQARYLYRYWALLFGNLQRAINEIYQTVECYENLSSCQETILVLENYIRDFKALAAWFRVSWDYDATPKPERRSLAWEVRKSNPAPKMRSSRNLASPALSGKSSPSFSGKNSPCPPIAEQPPAASRGRKTMPVMPPHPPTIIDWQHIQIRNPMFGQDRSANLQRLEEMLKSSPTGLGGRSGGGGENVGAQLTRSASLGELNDPLDDYIAEQRKVKRIDDDLEFLFDPNKKHQYSQTNFEDDHLTLAAYRKKYNLTFSLNAADPVTSVGEKAADDGKTVIVEVGKNEAKDGSEVILKEVPVDDKDKPTESKPANSLTAKRPVAGKQQTATGTSSGPTTSAVNYSSVLSRGGTNVTNTTTKAAPTTASGITRKTLHSTGTGSINRTQSFPVKKSVSAPLNKCSSVSIPGSVSVSIPKGPTANRNANAGSLNARTNHPKSLPVTTPPANAVRSKTMIEISRKRNSNPLLNSSNRLNKVSQDDLNSSTSTLKASTERIAALHSSQSQRHGKIAVKPTVTSRRSEPKQLPSRDMGGGGHGDTTPVSNDGWLTVKSKRRSSWSSRFHQPTGYASLPTLALLDEKADEDGTTAAVAAAKKQQTNTFSTEDKENIPRMAAAKTIGKNCEVERKANNGPGTTKHQPLSAPKMNKSKTAIDLKATQTAIKSNNKSSHVTVANKATSSILKSCPATTGALSTTGRSAAVNTSASKVKMNHNSNAMMRQKSDLTGLKIKSLHREYMRIEKMNGIRDEKRAIPSEEEEINATMVDMKIQTGQAEQASYVNLSSGEEDLIMEESDDDQRKLLEEQENLERQIRELENTEIDVDTETDETDYEALVDNDDDLFNEDEESNRGLVHVTHGATTEENMSLEMKYHLLLSEMSMGERMETLATLEAFVARHPGRAQELHQKLSSPSRRRSLHETLKKYQAKQARAAEKRESLLKEKAHKIQMLLARVEDVKQAKQQLIEEKRLRMEERLQRATENREIYLRVKVKKAHDEEEKLREIAFIKSLTEQNRRLDLLESSKEHEVRMHDLEQERQKRVEEKAAKEAAAERRRLEIEQERQKRLEKISETRREREKRVGKIQEQKEMERQKLATQKARDREERLQARQAAQLATTEELQRKINQKLQESTRRHEELIEHIRQRAQELGVPNRNNEDATSNHESDLSSTVSDVLEPNKGSKKKLKKLKQKLQEKMDEYMTEMPVLQSHHRRDSEVPKLMNLLNKGGGPQGLERPLGQLLRIVTKAQPADFHCMLSMDTLGVIAKMVKEGSEEANTDITRKAVIMAIQLYRNICSVCPQLTRHAILGNSICTLLDVLYTALQVPDETTDRQPVELSTELILCCTVAVSTKNSLKNRLGQSLERLPDVLSYSVLIGLIGALAKRCAKVREPVEQHQGVVLSLLATLGLLTNFAQICPKGPLDPTRYLSAAKQTELFGVITLLHSTILPIGECIPPRTISLAAATFNLLVTIADLDIATFQAILTEEVLALKYLDVVTILLKYCGPKATEKGETQAVIIDLIGTVGFFCVNNKLNQDLLVSPDKLVILKSVIKLPNEFQVAIYPTLVAVVWKNEAARHSIATEFDVESLDEYQSSQLAKRNKLIGLLK